MTYQVIVCPDEYCRGVNIIKDDGSKTAQCSKCDSQYPIRKYKITYESADRDDAVAARTKLLIKLNDDDMSFEEVKDKGYLDEPDRVFSKKEERESRTVKEIVRSKFRDIDEPSRQDVVDAAVKNKKIDEDKAGKAIDALMQDGEVINYGSYLRLLD